jgi:hypothetical protein
MGGTAQIGSTHNSVVDVRWPAQGARLRANSKLVMTAAPSPGQVEHFAIGHVEREHPQRALVELGKRRDGFPVKRSP